MNPYEEISDLIAAEGFATPLVGEEHESAAKKIITALEDWVRLRRIEKMTNQFIEDVLNDE